VSVQGSWRFNGPIIAGGLDVAEGATLQINNNIGRQSFGVSNQVFLVQ
jgi:hypothetical protein